eukprot:COSAG05_NODE_5794_length_1086_cov_1.831814_1_plen_195_part_10
MAGVGELTSVEEPGGEPGPNLGDSFDGEAAADTLDEEEVDHDAVLGGMDSGDSSYLGRRMEKMRERAGLSKVDMAEGSQRVEELRYAGASWYIIHPHAFGIKAWDGLQAMVVTYLFFQLPMLIAFTNTAMQLEQEGLLLDGEEPPTGHSQADYVVDALLFADWLLRVVRAHYNVDYYGVQRLVVAPRDIVLFWVK